MGTQNTSRQLRYLEEIRISLHRAGFGTLPLEGAQLPVLSVSYTHLTLPTTSRV